MLANEGAGGAWVLGSRWDEKTHTLNGDKGSKYNV